MKNHSPLIKALICAGVMLGSFLLGLGLILIIPIKLTVIISSIIVLVGALVSLIMKLIYVRCPHCGSYLVGRFAVARCCPYCGKKMI
ncbi:hypothetical protein SAMN02910353_02578 [Ruminococcus sp. YRD2003]|uniref:hypothetical protein n=1 Tax=Ruminococcus sp. YRD2003 TaxID=1452313 RepID=UPI0008CB9B8F|nr:hypothetical protein SAMN02910353_02578 [Ruminococcus flavefaciens]